MRAPRTPLLLYLAALGVTGLGVGIRVLLEPVWGAAGPFVTLFPAIMLSAWIGGLGPGLLAIAAAALAADYFWLEPYRTFGILRVSDVTLLATFVAVSVGVVLLTEAVTRARARLDALLDATPIGLGFHDASLRYVRVNRALAEINGRPAGAHVGRTHREILGEAAARVVAPIMSAVLRTGRAVHVPALRVPLRAPASSAGTASPTRRPATPAAACPAWPCR